MIRVKKELNLHVSADPARIARLTGSMESADSGLNMRRVNRESREMLNGRASKSAVLQAAEIAKYQVFLVVYHGKRSIHSGILPIRDSILGGKDPRSS